MRLTWPAVSSSHQHRANACQTVVNCSVFNGFPAKHGCSPAKIVVDSGQPSSTLCKPPPQAQPFSTKGPPPSIPASPACSQRTWLSRCVFVRGSLSGLSLALRLAGVGLGTGASPAVHALFLGSFCPLSAYHLPAWVVSLFGALRVMLCPWLQFGFRGREAPFEEHSQFL